MEIILLISVVLTPVSGLLLTLLPAGDVFYSLININKQCDVGSLACSDKFTAATFSFFSDIVFSVMLWAFYKVFKSIRLGTPFSRESIRCVSLSGWCFIFLSLYSIACNAIFSFLQRLDENWSYVFEFDNLIYIPVGVGIVIFGYVMKLGAEMKAEQELVI